MRAAINLAMLHPSRHPSWTALDRAQEIDIGVDEASAQATAPRALRGTARITSAAMRHRFTAP